MGCALEIRWIHAYVRTYVRTYVHTYVRTYVRWKVAYNKWVNHASIFAGPMINPDVVYTQPQLLERNTDVLFMQRNP